MHDTILAFLAWLVAYMSFDTKTIAGKLVKLLGIYAIWRQLIRPLIKISIKGKIVLVTGCDSGIGAACVRKFLKTGAIVYAGVLKEESIAEWKEYSKKHAADASGQLIPILLDVTNDKQVADAVKTVESNGAPFAALVNNAGVSAFGFAECLPLERFKMCMDVNYIGAVRVTKALLPLIRRDKGRMIMVGSVGDRCPAAFGAAYTSSKAAGGWFAECLRQEMAGFGVKVVLVEPGFFSSGLLNSASAAGRKESLDSGSLLEAYGPYDAMMSETQKPISIAEMCNGGLEGMEKQVGGAIVNSAVEMFPLTRNLVGIDANLLLRFVPYLPTWFVDLEFAMRHRKVHPGGAASKKTS
eukprot:gnl/MRDRNA2_/MRDRNA2_144058_c0_seq1.p1 gnl/MRDRNA2_/MRDRNA2_144058_c0~~gnl/MRDRNA2_/MRDRNA2_144058_c0_seq1.p1  ORF type:complete len:354 (-),score=65.94 gnl/MRDRNA2_/MRDRNA2_144058_c0_seq1:54-1115(-)